MALNTGQVTLTATASQIMPIASRDYSILVNLSTTRFWLGPAGVTPSTGVPVMGIIGGSLRIDGSAAIYGVTDSGSVSIAWLEKT